MPKMQYSLKVLLANSDVIEGSTVLITLNCLLLLFATLIKVINAENAMHY